jgi:cell division protein FtsL
MNIDTNTLLSTIAAQTQAMQDLTGSINDLVETNRALIDIVTGEDVQEDSRLERDTYMDGTPIFGD